MANQPIAPIITPLTNPSKAATSGFCILCCNEVNNHSAPCQCEPRSQAVAAAPGLDRSWVAVWWSCPQPSNDKWCAKCHGRFPDWRHRAKNQTWKPPERRKRVWSIMFFWIVMIPCVTKCNRKCNMYKCKAFFFLQANYSAKFLQELARPFPTAVPSRKRRWWH